jgi:hypothetical protein
MNSHSEPPREVPSDGEKRFDEEAAQRILRRAAEEQARWESEAVGSFTLEQLQEIATEAGISPEAVLAAAREHEANAQPTATPVRASDHEGAGGWLAAMKRRLPASWPPALQNAVLTAVGVALVGALIAILGAGPVVFALILGLIALLILLGIGLF